MRRSTQHGLACAALSLGLGGGCSPNGEGLGSGLGPGPVSPTTGGGASATTGDASTTAGLGDSTGIGSSAATTTGAMTDPGLSTSTGASTTGSADSSSTGPTGRVIMQCQSPEMALPDGISNGVFDTITMESEGTVEDVWISVAATHPYVGELGIRLLHGDAEMLLMFAVLDATFSCDGDDVQVTLREDAALPVQGTCRAVNPAVYGERSPFESLSVFYGMSAGGDWTLQAADMVPQNEGVFHQWCLMIRLAES